jgi:glycosyltransferase involved in cell wall biosynthesis
MSRDNGQKPMPRLSILIAALSERWPQTVIAEVTRQAAKRDDVEVLVLMDNRLRSVGAKRNVLLGMARGEYLTFIDDDDEIAPNYVEAIASRLGQADVIVFPHDAYLLRENVLHRCRYSLKYVERSLTPVHDPTTGDPATEDGRLVMAYTGPPAHTHVWRASIARAVLFPLRNWQEDIAWCDIVRRRAQTEVAIDDTLYRYLMDSEKSATRG